MELSSKTIEIILK